MMSGTVFMVTFTVSHEINGKYPLEICILSHYYLREDT